MGCSNARLLVQTPLTGETATGTMNPLSSPATVPASAPAPNVVTDTNNSTTRMHLTGVDLVVERNGSYTLLLTPKTHKQLMPYVLRKKRFRILVDKPRTDPTLVSNEPVVMENNREHLKKKSTVEAMEQMASQEFEKAKTRLVAGQSIDRVNVDDEEYIQSEDEGMIEEIVTTVEQDKDLECKIKKKIETKKTIAQQPNTNNTITKVVKTEVTEITRTITINDHHDLERAKRELGIDDVNRLLPLSTWLDQSHTSQIKEKYYEPINEVVTSKDFPSDSPIKKQTSQVSDEKPILAESTIVGRGPVVESIPSSTTKTEEKPTEIKKKKKKSKLCSCTRSSAVEDEQDKQKTIIIPAAEQPAPKKLSPVAATSAIQTHIQGQKLITDDLKQLIIDKKVLLIEYIHSKIFSPAYLFSSNEQDLKAKKISSRILDLLRYDRCLSWSHIYDQLTEEYAGNPIADQYLKPMINTYENLFTSKQANLLNTFSTIHNENDIENIHENNDYLNIAQTHINQSIEKTESIIEQTPQIIPIVESIEEEEEQQQEEVMKKDEVSEQSTKELDMSNETEQTLSVYNEEYLIKMLGDISQHKPITLAEAIAYEYLDIEDPKLGLSNETIQRIKSLFRPLTDDSASNVIRVKRSGEYFTDINLSETNPFEKFTENEPLIYQLQQTFEPTLDFNEKQFRSLTDALSNDKNQYDQFEFDVAQTSLPIYDLKEFSANDFSQSDSGYSMTTATHESLASKIKIEFEPINQDMGPIPPKREDLNEIEKIDLDKATQEQIDTYELSPELIQIIKADFNGTDKTVGQAILSRELRLDSTDSSDISYLNSLGIYEEQIRILTALFFPKQTRIIAYSPEPGRFVEAQTTFNPDYSGYKTDTTIIQIQEKQLSSDHLAKQRSVHDDRTVSQLVETEEIKPVVAAAAAAPPPPPTPPSSPTETKRKDISPAPEPVPTPAPAPATVKVKKRKSSTGMGLLSCFKSKKAKPGTEQQGPPTITVTQTTSEIEETKKPTGEKPIVDYAVLPDGKRIYIDLFRDRPGLDMSYRPDNFENRFVLPESKPAIEYERPITPEVDISNEPLLIQSNITENESVVQSETEASVVSLIEDEPRPTIVESVDVQSEAPPVTESQSEVLPVIETEFKTHLEPRPPIMDPVDAQAEPAPVIETESHVHLIPRSAIIEPVDVQPEVTPIVIPVKKSEEETVTKKSITMDLHGAAVDLPSIPLVVPGPLPTLPSLTKEKKETKVKKSSVGLCAACFGAKSAQKKKKSLASEPVQAPIEQEKTVTEEKQVVVTSTIEFQSTTITIDQPVLPSINIDQFRERTFPKGAEVITNSEVQVGSIVEKPVQIIELHYQAPTDEPVPSYPRDTSIFSTVNIDSFQERTLQKGSETNLKTEPRSESTNATVIRPVPSSEEPRYQVPTNEPVPQSVASKGTSIFSQVNIDTFRERTFQKSSENLPKSTERFESTDITVVPSEEPQYQPPTNEPSTPPPRYKSVEPTTPKDTSIFSTVNIDTFKERTFEKSSERLPKSTEHIEQITETFTSSTSPPSEEPHYQSPTIELSSTPTPLVKSTNESIKSTTSKDVSIFSTVNIDSFQERTLQKASESHPTSPKLLEHTEETVVVTAPVLEEPHYQSPTNEPVAPPPFPTPKSVESINKDTSIFSQVNIDSFKERTFEKSPQKVVKTTEESPYELPSSGPVPLISPSPVENTYDTPRSLELQQTEEQIINNETMTPSINDIQKSSGDHLSTETTKQLSKVEEISPIKTETTTSIETKKRSFTLPIRKKKVKEPKQNTNKKSTLLPSFFRQSEQKTKIPALDLPAVERDLSPNNLSRPPHRHDSDPLRVPVVELPRPDLPLPTYDRPEVDMTTGQIKQTSEFAIPKFNFSPIPNLQLPDNKNQSITINSSEMKVPNVQLPDLQLTVTQQKAVKLPEIELKTKSDVIPIQSTIETVVPPSTIVDETIIVKTKSHVSTVTKTQVIETFSQSPEQQITIIETYVVQSSTVPPSIEKANIDFQLPSREPVLIVPKDSKVPPSFDDDVPSPPIKIVPAVQQTTVEKQLIESKSYVKKKSSTLALCSCFGDKSSTSKEKTHSINAPKTNLPAVEIPLPSSNISSTLKVKEPLRAPSNDLPVLDLTAKSSEKDAIVPIQSSSPSANVPKSVVSKPSNEETKAVSTESKKSSPFDIKAPSVDIPQGNFSSPSKTDAYLLSSKQEETISIPEHIQSRSDSGLEVAVSSPIQPSSTLGDIQQLSSVSSGFGSDLFDNMTAKGLSLPSISLPEPTLVPTELKHDFIRKINLNDETRAKIIFRETELKTRLETELAQSIPDFDAKKDQKSLEKILTYAIDLIKDKKVSTYPELKQKLIIEHKNDAFLVDPIVHSLYYTIENHGLDYLDKPEFPLAIRDMVRLPAKQTYDTVTHLNKESASLTTTSPSMTKETLPAVSTVRSCLTCGRSKSKTNLPTTTTTTTTMSSSGLLDERRRTQLNTHRNDLANLLRDHIQSSSPPIRKFTDHPKDIEKIVRKSLTLLSQPKTISYEQIRHDLKLEFKHTYYLIDPIIDIIRDTFDHCDITQMNEKTNINILDSQISQTAQLYNNQMHLLNFDEYNALKNNSLSWLQSYLIDNELKEKKLTRKQTKELNKILHRSLDILSSNTMTTWDEFSLQLQREYSKAQDLCQRSVEILRQAQRNGLFLLQNAPTQDKRRASSLITDRARQNLKTNRNQIIASLKVFFTKYNKTSATNDDLEHILKKTFTYLEEQKAGQFKSYQNLKEQLKNDFAKSNQNQLIEQIVDVIEQAHATNQFDDIEKPEVQSLMKDRLDGKPLIIKEMYVSLPPRVGTYGDDSEHLNSSAINGDQTTTSHRVGRGLSWREANERARILFYRGKHPAIHYDEQAAAFDVRMLLETASGGTQEIPVTDSDVHELLNSCGVQWDGVNIISLVDHSEDVVRAAEQAALKVIREKGIVDLRTPPPPSTATTTIETTNEETLNSTS